MINRLWTAVVVLAIVVAARGRAAQGPDRGSAPEKAQSESPAKSKGTTRSDNKDDGPDGPRRPDGDPTAVTRVSLGPWTWRFSAPESLDLFDIADRIRSVFGMLAILGVAVFLSDNRRAISGRVIFWGLALQWAFALLVLRVPAGIKVLQQAGKASNRCPRLRARQGAVRLRRGARRPAGPAGFVFAFRVLPTVIFVAALFAVLYHLGIMQWIVRGFAVVMAWLMGTSGAESLNVAASLFLGQTEAPLTIRPYLARLTESELLTVMTVGHGPRLGRRDRGLRRRRSRGAAHPDGGDHDGPRLDPALEDPGPRDRDARDAGDRPPTEASTDSNVLDAAARGTRDGLHLALNIAAMLIAFVGFVALMNKGLRSGRHRPPGHPRLGDGARSPTCWASPGKTARASASYWARAPCSTS